jgi:hypothetical protein
MYHLVSSHSRSGQRGATPEQNDIRQWEAVNGALFINRMAFKHRAHDIAQLRH